MLCLAIATAPAQVAGKAKSESLHDVVSSGSEGGGGAPNDVLPKGGSSGADESVSNRGEGQEAESTSDSYLGADGGASAEIVPSFDPTRSGVETTRATEEEMALQREIQDLPPIELVLFDERPETVCGNDERVRITPTNVVPWRWNCQLILTLKDGSRARGTGWFIGPRTVMTAGHCVHTGRGGDWMRSIEVIPGLDAANRPYGSQVSTTFRSVTGWTRDGNVETDYGAVILPDATLGNRVGWFGFTVLTDAQLEGLTMNTAGYPGDKPSGTEWFISGPLASASPRRLDYMIDTAPGQSGSAVWRFQNNQRHAIGIHNYGGCPNHATRITQTVFDNMTNWKNNP
jgi:V8-like Glu-specific endopeptidase